MKRFLDLFLTLPGVLLIAPLMVLTAAVIRLSLGSPVIFRQQRPGLNGNLFIMYKFRTMTDDKDEKGLLPDEQRMTRLGNFLRNSSLDELPALLNVLKGEMSLVGPRPLLPEYLPLYTPEQSRRHEVKPGITGWAQIMGRNELNWEEKFNLDVWYVNHHSIILDLKILLLTILKVFKREGITQEGHVTMPKFTGPSNHEKP